MSSGMPMEAAAGAATAAPPPPGGQPPARNPASSAGQQQQRPGGNYNKKALEQIRDSLRPFEQQQEQVQNYLLSAVAFDDEVSRL